MTNTTPDSKPLGYQEPAVQATGVHKHYGKVHAVDGVDLTVARGEIFALIGHNGAGKSTLFKMMLGLLSPSSGDIKVNGVPVSGDDFRTVRRGIGYLPEHVVLYDNLSGMETLQFFARLKSAPAGSCLPLLDRVGLAAAANRPLREYSKGMRQRLGFAQALLGNPKVLFLDEPTSGLDPRAIRDFYSLLHGLREDGVTILITSHILAELQDRVDRIGIMAEGKLLALGSVQSLRDQVKMPLRMRLRLSDALLTVAQELLQPIKGLHFEACAEGLDLRCPHASKMDVLGALTALGSGLLDIQIHEPSLEDVFFGLSK